MDKFYTVTKDEFYTYICPLDVVVEARAKETLFKTRSGALVGKCNGYLETSDVAPAYYMLRKAE